MSELLQGRAAIAHLLRRAGFGASAADLDRFADASYDDAVDWLLDGLSTESSPVPAGTDFFRPGTIQELWLARMLATETPLAEKLAFFWHGHFATSNTKIENPEMMWGQYELFRNQGGGSFHDLVLGVSRDPAMIRWLDGNSNRNGHANENYARELQELFTLGIGNYTEDDIREIGRAFTGWGTRGNSFVYRKQFHDEGEKTIHGQTGNWNGEDVVRILTELPRCSLFISRKLLRFFSHTDPTESEIEAVANEFAGSKGHIAKALAYIFRSERFRARETHRALVKSPVEYCVGALRVAGVDTVPPFIHGGLDFMGQILFRPPSVKGWTSGTGWLSSGAIVSRLRVAQRIAALPGVTNRVEEIVDVAFQDDAPSALKTALEGAKDDRERVTMVLGCPEFQLA